MSSVSFMFSAVVLLKGKSSPKWQLAIAAGFSLGLDSTFMFPSMLKMPPGQSADKTPPQPNAATTRNYARHSELWLLCSHPKTFFHFVSKSPTCLWVKSHLLFPVSCNLIWWQFILKTVDCDTKMENSILHHHCTATEVWRADISKRWQCLTIWFHVVKQWNTLYVKLCVSSTA